jgi:hypothetical protein
MRGPSATTPSAGWAVALNTDGLLLEGMRRIDEQPRIGEVVKPETVFARVATVPVPPDLGQREAALLALIDGRSDVRTLAPSARLAEYEASEAFFNLHLAGLITAEGEVTLAWPARKRPAAAVAERPRSSFLQVVALALVLALSLAFRLAVHGSILPGSGAAARPEPLSTREAAALRFAEELYAAHRGRQATSVAELVRAGLLPGGYGRWDGITLGQTPAAGETAAD